MSSEIDNVFSKLSLSKKSISTEEYSLEIIYDSRKAKTENYDTKIHVFRRGTSFIVHLKNNCAGKLNNVGAKLLTSSKSTIFEILVLF